MKKITASALVSIAALLAFSSAQAAVATSAVQSLKDSASEQEVVAALGKPTANTHWANGTHSLSYDLKDNAQAQAYIDISDATGKVVKNTIIRRD